MTAHLKTPPSSSWSLQMTAHWSASSRTVTSLLTDRRLESWLSGAVLTTWSLTCSKLWRWSWTSKETPLPPYPAHHHEQHCDCSGVIQVPGHHPISQDLKWDNHFTSIVKKAQQRLYFLRQLRKFNLSQELQKQFYSAITESVLYTSITVWFSSATKSDLRRLQRVVRTAERIIGTTLPTLQEMYSLGMCNSDRLLEYSAVTAMINHENDDRGRGKILIGYSSILGGTLSSDYFACKCSTYRREKREKLGFEITYWCLGLLRTYFFAYWPGAGMLHTVATCYIASGNPSHEHLTINMEHTTLL